MRIWSLDGYPVNYKHIKLVKPNDILKQFSEQLYTRYCIYYSFGI